MPIALQWVMIVGLSVLAAVLGHLVVGHVWPSSARKTHNDVAGFIYAVLGVTYAVLLAWAFIMVWEDLGEARVTAAREANEVVNIYFLASQFPEGERERVQYLAHAYARTVVDEEWPLLQEGRSSPNATRLVRQLRDAIMSMNPQTAREQVLYDQALSRMHELMENRVLRLLQSREQVHPVLWAALIGGALLTVGFGYLFGLESGWVQALMIAALAGLLSTFLFLIAALDVPHAGELRVTPEAFDVVLQLIDGT